MKQRAFMIAAAAGVLLAALATSAVAQADAAPGKEIFEKRCTGCHGLDNEKEGPRLRGVYGRKAGAVSGFEYSDVLSKSGITWDSQTLDKWLTDPAAMVPNNDMPFRLADAKERAAVIQYLKDLPAK
jgi:cytochrome c